MTPPVGLPCLSVVDGSDSLSGDCGFSTKIRSSVPDALDLKRCSVSASHLAAISVNEYVETCIAFVQQFTKKSRKNVSFIKPKSRCFEEIVHGIGFVEDVFSKRGTRFPRKSAIQRPRVRVAYPTAMAAASAAKNPAVKPASTAANLNDTREPIAKKPRVLANNPNFMPVEQSRDDGLESALSNPSWSYLSQFTRPYQRSQAMDSTDSKVTLHSTPSIDVADFIDACGYCLRNSYVRLHSKNSLAKDDISSLTITYGQLENRFQNIFILPFSFAVREFYRFSKASLSVEYVIGSLLECSRCLEIFHVGCVLDFCNLVSRVYHKVNIPVQMNKFARPANKDLIHRSDMFTKSLLDSRAFPKGMKLRDMYLLWLKEQSAHPSTSTPQLFPTCTFTMTKVQCPGCNLAGLQLTDLEKAISCSRCFNLYEKSKVAVDENGRLQRALLGALAVQNRYVNHQPIYQNPNTVWICPDCVECSFCSSTSPSGCNWTKNSCHNYRPVWHSILLDSASTTERIFSSDEQQSLDYPQLDFLLCDECFIEYQEDHLCPVCSSLYSMEENSTPMLSCDSCEYWVHSACDPTMSYEIYMRRYENDPSAKDYCLYICPVCRFSAKEGALGKHDGIINHELDHKSVELAQAVPIICASDFLTALSQREIRISLTPAARYGNLLLLSLGQVPTSAANLFINTGVVYPIGYMAIRWAPSYKTSSRRTLYLLKIEESINSMEQLAVGDPVAYSHTRWKHPRFITIAFDDIDNPIYSTSVTSWTEQFLDRWTRHGASIIPSIIPNILSPEIFFGVTLPPILKMIERLPGLFSYEEYQYKSGLKNEIYKECLSAFISYQRTVGCSRLAMSDFPRKCPTNYTEDDLELYDSFSLSRVIYNESIADEDHYNYNANLDYGYDPSFNQYLYDYYSHSMNRRFPMRLANVKSLETFKTQLSYNSHLANVYVKNRKENFDSSKHCGFDLRYLALMRSGIQGYGIFALRPIPANSIIIEYVGEVISRPVAEDREKHFYGPNGIGTYIFTFEKQDVIDATQIGNAARFINHSCQPNCDTREIQVDGNPVVLIISNRHITPLEELTYDYRFSKETDNPSARIPCHCKASNCRGFMN